MIKGSARFMPSTFRKISRFHFRYLYLTQCRSFVGIKLASTENQMAHRVFLDTSSLLEKALKITQLQISSGFVLSKLYQTCCTSLKARSSIYNLGIDCHGAACYHARSILAFSSIFKSNVLYLQFKCDRNVR